MFTWDSSVCRSRESVSIMCYQGHTNRLIEEAECRKKDKYYTCTLYKMFFGMQSTKRHETAHVCYNSVPLRTNRTGDRLVTVQQAAQTQLFFFVFFSKRWRKVVLARMSTLDETWWAPACESPHTLKIWPLHVWVYRHVDDLVTHAHLQMEDNKSCIWRKE